MIIGKNKKKELEEQKRIEEQIKEEHIRYQEEITELEKENKRQCELKKLEYRQKQYEKKEHFKKIYQELANKKDLDANDLKLKNDIEKFFAEYEKEVDFQSLIKENEIKSKIKII